MAIVVSDGSSTHTINDKESKTILGLDFVGNGYGQVESIDKGLPSWNEKNIKNFLYLFSLIAQKINISDIVDNLTSTDTNKPLSAKQGKILNDLISSFYTKSQIDSLLSASGVSSSYPCSVFSTENMNFTAGSSSFKVVSENALSWVVQLTLDVEFSSVSDYSSGIVFSYDPALLPNSSYSECVRTESLSCRRNNTSMSCYCHHMSSYGSGKFKVVFGVNPNFDYHICGDVTILVFK